MSDTDADDDAAEHLFAHLCAGLHPDDREAFRRAAEAALASSPQCWGPGSIHRPLVPLWRKFLRPVRDDRGTGWDQARRLNKLCRTRSITSRAAAPWSETHWLTGRRRSCRRTASGWLSTSSPSSVLKSTCRASAAIRRAITVASKCCGRVFPGYCFTRIELQWHGVRQCPGVMRLVRSWGHEEPVHVPDKVIDALRARERDGAIDPPTKRGPRTRRIGDRVRIVFALFEGHSGLCTQVSRQRIGVLLLMLGALRQVR